ncbi:MAG: antibiotic biosynthesis monooxygenase [Pseudomonadota bacterium]
MGTAEIEWLFTMKINDGSRDAFEDMIAEMSDHAKENEPGTLGYQWMISEDGSRAEAHERYRDSAAGLVHMKSFNANFAGRLMELVQPTGMIVYGEPDDALREALKAARAVFMKPAAGFTR